MAPAASYLPRVDPRRYRLHPRPRSTNQHEQHGLPLPPHYAYDMHRYQLYAPPGPIPPHIMSRASGPVCGHASMVAAQRCARTRARSPFSPYWRRRRHQLRLRRAQVTSIRGMRMPYMPVRSPFLRCLAVPFLLLPLRS
ncbi:hypothetical protein B0H16DRAFT_1883936 [Mycena metata]|uniref:Uncharacterized protein n=1 Tax=Mycena metata TaxID=1033252 RepID=A0AAD7JG75_9AGAR|nr:hypothetical protein B0H16DRAFT_1883936 [Mycena metata]